MPLINPRKCFELLQTVSTKLIPPVPRQALIRWWLRGEADLHFWNHSADIHTSTAACFCGCGTGQYRPHGMNGHCVAACHMDRPDGLPTALWLHAATVPVVQLLLQNILLPAHNAGGQQAYTLSEAMPDTCGKCWLCQQGDNTVEHWITFCPVANAVLSIILKRMTTPADWFPQKGIT